MNKEESLALFAQGPNAWNNWAARMLAEREALESQGAWTAGENSSVWNEATRQWRAEARADFSEHEAKEAMVFSGVVFPSDAKFNGANFSGDADFGGATFSGDADFSGTTFLGAARFDGARFTGAALFDVATFSGTPVLFIGAMFSATATFGQSTFAAAARFEGARFLGDAEFTVARFAGAAVFAGATFSRLAQLDRTTFAAGARFDGSTFSGNAVFIGAQFSGDAYFQQAVFEGFTEFDSARFEKAADFCAIQSKSAFSLATTTFLSLPDFIQAHFAEAPRFDNFHIRPQRYWPSTLDDVKKYFRGNRDLPARWRALKRLAVQGHDHMHELEFFENELTTERWSTDRPWQPKFWFVIFYGWFSGFGRSIVRPLFWWTASVLIFAPLYLGAHLEHAGKTFSAYSWVVDRFVLQPFGWAVAPPLQCLAGPGDPWRAALGISVRKALLFLGLDSSDKLTLNYACLYNIVPPEPGPSKQLPSSFYLDVPNSVIGFGVIQHVISAVLLFLLLLAIRNHFRIK